MCRVRARNAVITLALLAVAGCAGEQEASFIPTEDDPDPSQRIPGVAVYEEINAPHVQRSEQVDYERVPPTGGPHDVAWAECTGTVYEVAVRNENMVHSLEHGAVWIAYHPELVAGEDLEALVTRVQGQPYTMLSPYPDLPTPISLQAWGRQLRVNDAQDERIDQFLQALRANPYTSPEPGAPCEAFPGTFDLADPPKFGT